MKKNKTINLISLFKISIADKNNIVQFARFLFSGTMAVLTDAFSYFSIMSIVDFPEAAKFISFILGSLVAFFLNKFFTFKVASYSRTEFTAFAVLYSFTLLLNTSINGILYRSFNQSYIAFIAATSVSTIVNFLGMKFYVFDRSKGKVTEKR